MKIILDGPDASGKTTIAEYVRDKYDFKLVHLNGSAKNDLEMHMDILKSDEKIVCDRFLMGEFVYPEIYGRESKLTIQDAITLMKKAMHDDDLYFMFYTTNIDILNERLIERNEIDYLDEIEQQNTLFMKIAYTLSPFQDDFPHNFIFIDIARPNAYDFVRTFIDSYVERKTKNDYLK